MDKMKNRKYCTRQKIWERSIVCIISLVCLCDRVISLGYECTPNQREVSVGVANCSNQLLSLVPPLLPHNIRMLDLSNNRIKKLVDYSFVKYEILEILYLRNNSLTRIEPKSFERLSKLQYLDMSFNNLLFIPSQTFHDLSALLTLSLKGNRITSIQRYTFRNISTLTSLYLSGNHIRNIHPNAFWGLKRLQLLEMQSNALTSLNNTVFRHFTQELRDIKLFNNPWYCDCNLRWLVTWLQNASDTRGQGLKYIFNSVEPVCEGPSIVKQRPFSSLTSDLFLCPIRMYSKARNIETLKGREVQIFCKYVADPHVEILWLKNSKVIDMEKEFEKYETESEGDTLIISRLHIYNFQYEDIGEYECYAENKLGRAFDSCLVTLEGVDPLNLLMPDESTEQEDKDRTRNAIIASSTIGGVVLLLVIIGFLTFGIVRCKQYRKKKKESIRMTFEEHLKANGIMEPDLKKDGLEQLEYDDEHEIDGNMSLDAEMEENESLYDSLQRPRVPSSSNTNTYISFKTEFSEPEDMTQVYAPSTQNSHCKGSDGSQCESTSPLLENISPILIDPHDPFYEANSIYVPRLNSFTANYLNSTPANYLNSNRQDYPDDEHGFIPYTNHTRTLPQNGYVHRDDNFIPQRTRTLPHGYSPSHMHHYGSPPVLRSQSVCANPHIGTNHKSASVGHLGISPPKKPPRAFYSRDTMSLHSQNSDKDSRENGGPKFSLPKPKPGSVDQYGTAV